MAKTAGKQLGFASSSTFVLLLLAGGQAAWNAVMFVTDLAKPSFLLSIHAAATLGWLSAAGIWLLRYREKRFEAIGWAYRKRAKRRESRYTGDGEDVEVGEWQAFFQTLAEHVYTVKNAAGQPVVREALAREMHTSVGLINDLYPKAPFEATMDAIGRLGDLAHAARGWRRLWLRHRLRQLYARGGWLTTISLTQDCVVFPRGVLGRTLAVERCKTELQNLRLGAQREKGIIPDQWQLYYLLADPDALATAMLRTACAYRPGPLRREVLRWWRIYAPLILDTPGQKLPIAK